MSFMRFQCFNFQLEVNITFEDTHKFVQIRHWLWFVLSDQNFSDEVIIIKIWDNSDNINDKLFLI